LKLSTPKTPATEATSSKKKPATKAKASAKKSATKAGDDDEEEIDEKPLTPKEAMEKKEKESERLNLPHERLELTKLSSSLLSSQAAERLHLTR
jgi:hypothetical protein